MVAPPRMSWHVALALAIVYVVWSSTYFAIRVVVLALPPLLSGGARFAFAGAALLAIDRARGRALPPAREWARALPVGLLMFAGGNGLVAIAERTASSGAAALACALAPAWAAILALPFGERPTRKQWLGFVIGFAGVAILSKGAMPDRSSAVLLLLAPICWALGTVLTKRLGATSAALQLFVGGLATCAIGAALREPIPHRVPASAWIALAYLAIIGSMVAYTAYIHLVKHAPVSVAMSYAYVNPVLAVILGAAAGGEKVGAAVIASGALVTLAVVLIVRR